MSTAVKQFHEEEAIGKTYDFQVARRLLRYLRPYVRFLVPAILLTLGVNWLTTLQPKFTQWAIDWYILPGTTEGSASSSRCFSARRCCDWSSLFQAIFVNSVGQYTMFDLRRELYASCNTRKSPTTTAIQSAAS